MATFDGSNHGVGGFASTGVKPLVQLPQSKYKKGQNKKNPLSPTLGSYLWQAQNSINMVVNVGLGPSSLSWLAQGSTDGWEVESLDNVPRGTTIEVGKSIVGVDSSSRTPQWSTLEILARIGHQHLRVLVDSESTSNYIDAQECIARRIKVEDEDQGKEVKWQMELW